MVRCLGAGLKQKLGFIDDGCILLTKHFREPSFYPKLSMFTIQFFPKLIFYAKFCASRRKHFNPKNYKFCIMLLAKQI